MLRCKSLLGALALVLIVSLASAQEQPGGRGRGGFGGRGGPAAMFNSPTALLRMPEVRKELNTTDEQNKEVDAALQELAPPPGGFGNFQDLSNEERQKRFEEMQKKGEEVDAKVKKILKPEQSARLNQLLLQRQGANAWARPEVAKQLGLTQEQQDKIQKIQEESRPPRGGGGGFQNLSDEERQKMQERREKAQADMLAVLTDEQQTKWAEMTGKKFDFPQFGGAGGGGFGGAGGERRRPATKQ
jgi:Spy/CpxP family protein refolding chaperone